MAARKKRPGHGTKRARPAATAPARVVEASEFRLVDRAGRVRALLSMSRAGPRLEMMQEDGTIVLEVALTGDGAGAKFADGAGEPRVFIGTARGAARLGMADKEGSPRLFVGLGSAGTPEVTLYDDSQRRVWSTRASGGKPRR